MYPSRKVERMGNMKKRLISICMVICLSLMNFTNVLASNSIGEYTIDVPYDFPIAPGDEEWKDFLTTEDMIAATQVPEEILHKMTTSALIKTMLYNPFILGFQYSNDSFYAFEMLEKNFNVFEELQTRVDYKEELIKLYGDVELATSDELANSQVVDRFLDTFNLEVLIAYELSKNDAAVQIYAQDNEISDIETIHNQKQEVRSQEEDVYSTHTDGFVWFSANSNGQLTNDSEISILATTTATVLTPKQTKVTVKKYDELTNAEITAINSRTDRSYPNATRTYTATKRFNCHSYAWYSQSTSTNKYWMDNPSAYWTDGSYVSSSAAAGRKVRYMSGQHSAIMYRYTSGEIYYVSKWGQAGVYKHSPSYGPSEYNYGAGVKYYKYAS